MEKNTGKNETSTSEGIINPDVVFTGDALVVDYLTTLLTSTPATSLDSSEIHMLHLAIEAGWKLVGGANATNDTALNIGNGLSKLEAEALESENKHLKFKEELAHIDTQVLRSENSSLKVEIAGLKTELREIQDTLETLLNEKNELQSRLDVHQKTVIDTGVATPLERPHTSDQVIEESGATEPEDIVPGGESCDAADQKIEPELIQDVQHNIVPHETVRETSPPPVITAAPPRMNHNISSGVAEERAFIARAHPVDGTTHRVSARDAVLFSPHRSVVAAPTQSRGVASKIIKQHQSMDHQNIREIDRIVKDIPQPPALHDKPVVAAVKSPDVVQQPIVPEPDKPLETRSSPHEEPLHKDGTAEIDVEPAPAPKIVVRRNVMNYEDLQKEADSAHDAAAGHTIIL